MPAYSFKERFVPMVLDGSKPHTIRTRRKKGFAKIGDALYLYFGMRTKWCRKLREEKCVDVKSIIINNGGLIYLMPRLTDQEYEQLVIHQKSIALKCDRKEVKTLNEFERNQLAWRDGFRPEGSTLQNPAGAFELMMRFWNQTHSLPFIGDIIYWDPQPKGFTNYGLEKRSVTSAEFKKMYLQQPVNK